MPHASFSRADRVGHLLQQEISKLVMHEIKDPRVGFVTITEARVTKDLRQARVFVSVYGEGEARQQSLDGLRAATGFLRREIGRRLKLRFTPELDFELDETLDKAARLEQVFHAIDAGEQEIPNAEAGPDLAPVTNARIETAKVHDALHAMPAAPGSRQRRRKSSGRNKGR